MKVTQESERTFTVVLNDNELDDVMHEAVYSSLSSLDVVKSVFFMTFVQVMSCRYLRRTQGLIDLDKIRGSENAQDDDEPDGG